MVAADALGADWVAVYLAGAVACMLAVSALAFVLDGRLRALDRSRSVRVAVVATCLIAPVLTRAAPMGHPGWAGIALGAAVAAKPWALVAVLPALIACPRGALRVPGPLILGGAALLTACAAALPFLLAGTAGVGGSATALQTATGPYHPTHLFWPLREVVVDPVSGVTGHRGNALVQHLSHPLIVLLALPLSAIFAVRLRAGRVARADALLLLALLLFLRCLLDPWNSIYYVLPAILALVSWEAVRRERLPVGALALAALTWLTFVQLPGALTRDALAAVYLAWALPATFLLARAGYGVRTPRTAAASAQPAISATAARTSAGAI
jgi:hypothetical protein